MDLSVKGLHRWRLKYDNPQNVFNGKNLPLKEENIMEHIKMDCFTVGFYFCKHTER